MNAGIAEILGVFVVVVGCAFLVGAASLLSTALGFAAAGALLVLAGILIVYVSALADRAKAPTAKVPQ